MMTKLTSEQLSVVDAPLGISQRVIACAGSGKTTTILHRIQKILRSDPTTKGENILLTTFTHDASRSIQERLDRLLGTQNGVRCSTIDSFCASWIRDCEPEWAIDSAAKGASNEAANEAVNKTEAEPTEAEPTPTGSFHVSELICVIMERMRKKDPTLVSKLKNIRYLVVDEYQDINAIQEEWTMWFHRTFGTHILVVGDDNQNIYTFRGSDVRFILRFADPSNWKPGYLCESYNLTYNYRSSEPLVAYANHFSTTKMNHPDQLAALPMQSEPPKENTKENKLPTVVHIPNDSNCVGHFRFIEQYVKKFVMTPKSKYKYGDIVILSRNNQLLYFAENYFLSVRVPVVLLEGDEQHRTAGSPNHITLSTIHKSKGMEWEIVFLIGCDDYFFPISWATDVPSFAPNVAPFVAPFDGAPKPLKTYKTNPIITSPVPIPGADKIETENKLSNDQVSVVSPGSDLSPDVEADADTWADNDTGAEADTWADDDTEDPAQHLAVISDKHYSEERRLFYVAITRARTRLFLICGTNQPSRFLKVPKAETYLLRGIDRNTFDRTKTVSLRVEDPDPNTSVSKLIGSCTGEQLLGLRAAHVIGGNYLIRQVHEQHKVLPEITEQCQQAGFGTFIDLVVMRILMCFRNRYPSIQIESPQFPSRAHMLFRSVRLSRSKFEKYQTTNRAPCKTNQSRYNLDQFREVEEQRRVLAERFSVKLSEIPVIENQIRLSEAEIEPFVPILVDAIKAFDDLSRPTGAILEQIMVLTNCTELSQHRLRTFYRPKRWFADPTVGDLVRNIERFLETVIREDSILRIKTTATYLGNPLRDLVQRHTDDRMIRSRFRETFDRTSGEIDLSIDDVLWEIKCSPNDVSALWELQLKLYQQMLPERKFQNLVVYNPIRGQFCEVAK